MSKVQRSLGFLFVIVLVIGLSACVRSINGPGKTANPPSGTAAAPAVATGDVMSQLELFVTQTAMAAQGGAGPSEPGAQATLPAAPPEGGTPGAPADVTPAAPVATDTAGAQPTQPAAPAQPTAAPIQPTAAPVVAVPTATPGIPKTYALQKGESPYCVARRFNLNPVELLNLNGLSPNQSLYQPGTVLQIPQSGNPFPGGRALQAHPATYTVGGGESIYEIACSYGDVSPEAIAFANNLSAPYSLTAGQTLQIP